MIVLDTNVLSEILRPSPAAAVMRWMSSQPATARTGAFSERTSARTTAQAIAAYTTTSAER